MHDLMKNLIDGNQEISSLSKSVTCKLKKIFSCLQDIPIIELVNMFNKEKAQKIISSIDKIVALAHVSQSMGNYFARDDSLDPALNVVCQGLRGSINFEHVLRSGGGTFQSLASAYWHLKSEFDHDFVGSTQMPRGGLGRGGAFGKRGSGRNPQHTYTPRKKPCWLFQRSGQCSRQGCWYDHRCTRCGNRNHGERECRSR